MHVTALPAIKELEIGVELLTSRVFATLTARFPSLKVLSLSYDKTGHHLTTCDSALSLTDVGDPDRVRFAYGFVEFREDMEKPNVGD
ncbi:hypothetical protein AN958_10561 [Leucoagaricus sp. SymC.cos]|nr:hypothetical protein AN958_10561 [Leucoagaricus sp. SymC.cos]